MCIRDRLNPEHTVSLRRGQRFRPDKELIRRILQIGVPNGLENSLFQLGRVLVVSMISLFGTTQITANAADKFLIRSKPDVYKRQAPA